MNKSILISLFLIIAILPVSIASIPETLLISAPFTNQAPAPICPEGFSAKLILNKSECRLGDEVEAVFEIKNISDKPRNYLCENMFQSYLFIIRNMDTKEEYHASISLRIHSGPPIYVELLKPNEKRTRRYTITENYGLRTPGTYEITYIWPLEEGAETKDIIYKINKKTEMKLKDLYPDIAGLPKRRS